MPLARCMLMAVALHERDVPEIAQFFTVLSKNPVIIALVPMMAISLPLKPAPAELQDDNPPATTVHPST